MFTKDDIQSYHRDGFVVARQLFTPAEIEALREATDRKIEESRQLSGSNEIFEVEPDHSSANPRLRRIIEPVCVDAAFWQAAVNERLLAAVSALLGANVKFHHSKLNMKTSGGGAAIGWHQDYPFFPHTNMDLVACGIPLDRSTRQNGCLLVVPGTQRGQTWSHRDGADQFVGQITDEPLPFAEESAVPVEMEPGDVSFHHCNVVHGSLTNTSSEQRRLLIFQYAAADALELEYRHQRTEYFDRVVCGQATPHARLMGETTVALRGNSNGRSIFGSQEKKA
jgi:phytanoyl-CoA hydroxylase